MKPIAYMRCDFKEKFGIPRQSGIANSTLGQIVFLKEYSTPEAFRGLDEYSHIWIIWEFSMAKRDKWSPTVRPPRLGGNCRMGVFATRSPFRPNPIGLSSVKIHDISRDNNGCFVITVSGADLQDGTPIYDIKPYLTFTDSHPDAKCGFADNVCDYRLTVSDDENLLCRLSKTDAESLLEILKEDPRPSYIEDPERIYTFQYSSYEISFKVSEKQLRITDVREI